MSVKKEVSKFVSIVVAKLTGDKSTEVALRNEKLAKSAIKGQISALEAKLVKDEIALETAVEAYESAIYPTDLIVDAEQYVRNIKTAQEKAAAYQDTYDATQESITFFQALLDEKF